MIIKNNLKTGVSIIDVNIEEIVKLTIIINNDGDGGSKDLVRISKKMLKKIESKL